jgi:hypothetical protein
MAICSILNIGDLGKGLVLAPERYDPRRNALTKAEEGTCLREIAETLRVTVGPGKKDNTSRFLVLDTSDAQEGVIVCRKQSVSLEEVGSTKKTVERGCVLVSRLRPYLRQVALADGAIPGWNENIQMICSTEYFVLRSVDGQSISFLVPFLLSGPVQTVLAASQEGGHHPRFNEDTLLDLSVPMDLLKRRAETSKKVEEATRLFRESEELLRVLVEEADGAFKRPSKRRKAPVKKKAAAN